jgi:hypothetical protein
MIWVCFTEIEPDIIENLSAVQRLYVTSFFCLQQESLEGTEPCYPAEIRAWRLEF